jgi:hypothetical protein
VNMENNRGSESRVLSPREEAARVAILAECDKLAKAGVTFVAVHFDGYGDEGTTEEVSATAANGMRLMSTSPSNTTLPTFTNTSSRSSIRGICLTTQIRNQ